MTEQLLNIDKSLLNYLAETYNIQANSVLYNAVKMLIQRLWQGSICVSFDDLKERLPELELRHLSETDAVGKDNEIRPIIFNKNNIYIQRYFVYQKIILKKIDSLEKNGKLRIITGGPGTGKTTSLARELVEILKKEEIKAEKILLAAPTGKAAFRMNEALKNSLKYDENKEHTHWVKESEETANQLFKLEAKTIHRLLGTRYLSVNFNHTKDNPLDAGIIVIDECSMVDLPMMAKLLDAVPDNSYLFLLGDKNQLASIEAGSVFADICNKYNKTCYIENELYKEKHKNYRAKEAPGIVKLSIQILNNTAESFKNFENIKYFENLSFDDLMDNYKELINAETEETALNILKDFQILCSVKRGKNGTININRELIKRFKKNGAKYTPLIINENNYSLKLFNGDVGVKDGEYAYFSDKDSIRKFHLLTLPGYDDAFAITIHKSQGSEYAKTAIVYPDSEKEEAANTIFTRELLYTAITRAKKECLIYGSEKLLLESCKRQIYRASGIN